MTSAQRRRAIWNTVMINVDDDQSESAFFSRSPGINISMLMIMTVAAFSHVISVLIQCWHSVSRCFTTRHMSNPFNGTLAPDNPVLYFSVMNFYRTGYWLCATIISHLNWHQTIIIVFICGTLLCWHAGVGTLQLSSTNMAWW